jgi:VIT1/CCC1 family predicted Fe2+/Mn2+ transporter
LWVEHSAWASGEFQTGSRIGWTLTQIPSVSGYLAAQAEQDLFRHKFTEYTRRLEIACGSEVDREVHEVLAPLGVTEDVSRAVSNSLVQAALADEVASFRSSDSRTLFGHRFSWMNRAPRRHVPTTGTTAFLLKFGEGMEEVPSSRLFASAFTIGASYALGGLVPLLPYFFIDKAFTALYWSIVSFTHTSVFLAPRS